MMHRCGNKNGLRMENEKNLAIWLNFHTFAAL